MYNANNYGYNPYGTYIPQRPMPQPIIPQVQTNVDTRPVLTGKQVDGIDVVKAMDIPMDGTVSYFPIADGSAIVTKQLQMDGTSKMVVYKPYKDETRDVPKYLTQDDLEDMREDIKDLKQEIKDMKKAKKKDE